MHQTRWQSVKQKTRTYRSFKYILGAVLTYSIGSFYFGYCLSYFNSFDFKQIHKIFGISTSVEIAQGIFSGCLPFGALFGAYFSSHIIKRLSRRQSFIAVDTIAIIANLLILFAYPSTLLIGRLLQGFCVGIFSSLIPLMIKQISPVQLSGSFGAIMIPSIGVGFFSSYLLSYILSHFYQPSYFWIIVFALPIVIIDIQIFLIYKLYNNQTPKYLISEGRTTQAKQLIQKIYLSQFVQAIYQEQLTGLGKSSKQQQTSHKETDKQNQLALQELGQDIYEKQNNPFQKLPANSQKYPADIKLARIVGFGLQCLHQLSGINVVVIFGHHLAEMVAPQLKAQMPLIINGQKIIAGICGTFLLRKFGRRKLMLRGLLTILISHVCLTISFNIQKPQSKQLQIFMIIFLLTFVSAFVMTQGPITWLYVAEIVQPPTVPYTSMMNWIFACLIITLFPIFRNHSGMIFGIFGIFTFVNLCMCYFLMSETKDKTQIEVREQFKVKEREVVKYLLNMKTKLKLQTPRQ